MKDDSHRNIPLAMNEMKKSVRVHLQNSSNYQLHSSVCLFPFLCACLFPYSALLVTVCLSIPSLPLRVFACFLSFPTTFQASETWLLLTKACNRSVNHRRQMSIELRRCNGTQLTLGKKKLFPSTSRKIMKDHWKSLPTPLQQSLT